MERLFQYFNKTILGFVLTLMVYTTSFCSAQGNCLIYGKNSGERKACELSYEAIKYKQGSIESQILFDSAIAIGPRYAWAYYQKSVPFFKRGLLSKGISILNKAIKLAPQDYLCYRAYWYFQHQSYASCKRDLEEFYLLPNSYMTFTPGGDMDMRLLLAISCFKMNEIALGIETIKSCLEGYKSDDYVGEYDYYVLGRLYYENGQYLESIKTLNKQLTINPSLIDSYYYLALAYKANSNLQASKKNFQEALLRFDKKKQGYVRSDFGDRLYREDVIREMSAVGGI